MNLNGAFSWDNIGFLLDGLRVTIEVAIFTILISIIVGFLLGIIRYFEIPVVSKVVGWIVDIIRNLPLLLIIFFTYFALPQLGVSLNVFWSTVVAMSIFEATMISEILRGGLMALPNGQMEAGLATGLKKSNVMYHILLPQATKEILPSLVSQLIALIKDTSLATIITLPELTHNAKIIYGQDTSYVIPMFIALAGFYFIICFALSVFSKYLAKRMEAATSDAI